MKEPISQQRWPNSKVSTEGRQPRSARRGSTVVLGLVAVLGTTLLLPAGAAEEEPEETSADMVIEWNANAQTAIINTAGQGPLSVDDNL